MCVKLHLNALSNFIIADILAALLSEQQVKSFVTTKEPLNLRFWKDLIEECCIEGCTMEEVNETC